MDILEIRKLNIRALSNEYGRSTLAEMLGYQDTNYLNQLCSGHSKLGNRTARKIEKTLGLDHGAFDHLMDKAAPPQIRESSPPNYNTESQIEHLLRQNPKILEALKRNPNSISATVKVPVYKWERINQALKGGESPARWINVDANTANETTIASTMQGVSMASLTLPSIPANTTLIIQPSTAIPDELPCTIIASINGDTTCRQLTREAGQYHLEALNKDYKPTPFNPETDQILGIVVSTSTL